ncbi:MAG: mannose-1-phosphate guanylyltransferase [Chloroflexota bacterium]
MAEITDNRFYAVIMAGGGGTRLWPLSRSSRPKQMLRLGSQRTLFQLAVDRLEGLIPAERILVVTGADMADDLRADCPQIPTENYLLEPAPKGTAAVVGLAAAFLSQKDPLAVMAVLTADHVIQDVRYFQRILRAAKRAAQSGLLVTLGIHPTSPSTGYGYIQRGEKIAALDGQDAYQVLRFKEKPDVDTARKMLESGDHDWNSGMFIWTVSRIREEIARQMPLLEGVLKQIEAAWTQGDDESVKEAWATLKPQTIDYGIMENATRVAVIPAAGLGWNDVGSWDSLFSVLEANQDGNIILADQCVSLDTHNVLVLSENKERLVATIGVQDMIIVDSGHVILVCHASQAQKVREVVQALVKNNQKNYL